MVSARPQRLKCTNKKLNTKKAVNVAEALHRFAKVRKKDAVAFAHLKRLKA